MRKLLIISIVCSFVSIAVSKEVMIQPWQKENILIPSISTTFKQTATPTQLRLLTKYNTVEQAYADLQSFILALPVDSNRTLQTVADKKEELIPALDKLIRSKAVLTGFEYTSDSSAQINIALDAKSIVGLFQPYWKPEPVPKPKKVKVKKVKKDAEQEKEAVEKEEKAEPSKESKETKDEKPVVKSEEKKVEPAKPVAAPTAVPAVAPAKSDEKKAEPPKSPIVAPMKPEDRKGDIVNPEPVKPKFVPTPTPPPAPAPKPVLPPPPNPNVKKENQPDKQDSTTP